ncbi:MAG: uridine kinase [Microbacteriaceae bacterium]
MVTWALAKRDTLDGLAAEILHNYGKGRAIVAIDGIEGAGTTPFADDLAAAFKRAGHPAFRASISDFQRPRADRYLRGQDSAEGYYRDTFDYSVFRRVLIEPFRMGGSTGFVTSAFDTARDTQVEPKWLSGPADAILIVDGIFLNRPELRGLWNYSVWLEVPQDVAEQRLLDAATDGSSAIGDRERGGMQLYRADAKPTERAMALIDNSDPEHPQRIFADSC